MRVLGFSDKGLGFRVSVAYVPKLVFRLEVSEN